MFVIWFKRALTKMCQLTRISKCIASFLNNVGYLKALKYKYCISKVNLVLFVWFSSPIFAVSCASNYEHFSHAHLSHDFSLHFCSQFQTDTSPLAGKHWQLLALCPLSAPTLIFMAPPSLAEESFSNYILLVCILSSLCSFIRHHKLFAIR